MPDARDVTALLRRAGEGDGDAAGAVAVLVYHELRHLAHRQRFRFRHDADPGTTSLIHEAFTGLVGRHDLHFDNRTQFFLIASGAMRRLLVDAARRRSRQKRGGLVSHVDVALAPLVTEQRSEELLALDEALADLAREDERLAQIVECRFFGGLSVEETSEALRISPATIKRGWSVARIWLHERLTTPPRERTL